MTAAVAELQFAERVDRLMSTDVGGRGVIDRLYPMARKAIGGPLCMSAAELLTKRVVPESLVVIATGWPDRPHIAPEIAETDGPPGAAVLARALRRGLGAVPAIAIEPSLVKPMERVVEAAGLRALTLDQAIAAARSRAPIHAAAVLPLSPDKSEAENQSRQLVAAYSPAAVIAIEKGGMNDQGFIHTSRGDDTTEALSKADYLFAECINRGIATVGIGDGGNEIGMGVIAEGIRRDIPFGAAGREPTKGGIAPQTLVDVLIAAAISNWGAYGVAACLAFLLGRLDLIHDAATEERVLRVAADVSFIDGITGLVEPSADGIVSSVHQAFVTLLGETVRQALKSR